MTAARQVYERILDMDPWHVQTVCNYAALLHNEEEYDRAEAMYQRARNLNPSDSETLTNYGVLLYEHRKDRAGAENMYRRALRCDCCLRVRHVHQEWCSMTRVQTLYRVLELYNLTDGRKCEGYEDDSDSDDGDGKERKDAETKIVTPAWALVSAYNTPLCLSTYAASFVSWLEPELRWRGLYFAKASS
jgi:tetratricopeptide (TPR) repeat protein